MVADISCVDSGLKISRERIAVYAAEAGFTVCGVARARVLSEHAGRLAAGLAASGEGVLPYLADRPERRLDPSRLVAGARTVISCAVNYRNRRSEGYEAGFEHPKICSYALSSVYQPKMKAMLAAVLVRLKSDCPGLSGRVLCDTSAILEKAWAVEAGLGWIGKNSLLINPVYGSFLLLGEIVVDAECDRYDEPYGGRGCGDCRLCMDTCPAQALPCAATVDTGRCVSALSIEKSRTPSSPGSLHGWIFGCDECQSVCPFNRGRPLCSNPAFMPLFDPGDFPSGRWLAMDENEFNACFGDTPLSRAGAGRIKKLLPL